MIPQTSTKPYLVNEQTAAPGDWLNCFGYLLTSEDKARQWLHGKPEAYRLWLDRQRRILPMERFAA